MRLFIAIPLPEEVISYAKELQSKLPDAQYTLPNSFHLTLAFLGDATPQIAEHVQKQLASVSFTPFQLRTTNTGFFPNQQHIRVVWLGLEPKRQVQELQKQVQEMLPEEYQELREFIPHITLARVKHVDDKNALVRFRSEKQLAFDVTCFQLMESKLTPDGPEYNVIATFS